MMHTTKSTLLTTLTLTALILTPLGCDSDPIDDDRVEAQSELEPEAAVDAHAVFEAQKLASEAREAGVEVEGYVCEYGEAPDLVDACARRASSSESAPTPELKLTTAPSQVFYSCVGYCGGQAPGGCFCDDWCWIFGDCCYDVEPVCW